MPKPKQFIVELTPFEGVYGSVQTENRPFMYNVGQLDRDGVIRFVDEGYPSISEIKAAWPELEYAP